MKRLTTVLVLIAMLFPVVGVAPTLAAGPGDVVINEIMQNPSAVSDSAGEWFELFNATGSDIDINGWTIEDNDFDSHVIANGGPLIIPAGGFLVLGNNGNPATNGGVTVDYAYGSSWFLSNSADEVVLLDDSLVEIDRVEYDGGPDFPDPNGASMALIDPALDNNVGDNWCVATTPYGFGDLGTPGAVNDCAPQPLVVTIMEIQGDDHESPYEGELVTTSGVVTLFTSDGRSFWLQDPLGDGDPATSDGIFVFRGADLLPSLAVGDAIHVTASVVEYRPYYRPTDLTLTELGSVSGLVVDSSGNPLPAPIELNDLPDESIEEGIDFWEPLEGMLVAVHNAPVVAATSGYGEFAMLTKDDAKPGSGFYPQTQQIFLRNLGGEVVDYNPERILVDDSSLDEAIYVMPGDRVRSLVGALDYTFGNYKIQPASFDVKTHNLPNLPASTRSGPNGDTVITTFNVENLFDLDLNVGGVVDAIGQVGFRPEEEWGSGDTSTKDNTIRRLTFVCQGDSDETDAFDPTLEWEGFAQNTFDGLGAHTSDCTPAAGLFFSEYVEGSGYNKALEIYNGTGAAVNLGAGGYDILMSFNGGTSTYTIDLTGTVADGDVYVVAPTNATDPTILAEADQFQGTSWFNGDDAVVLRKGGKDDASSTPSPEELEIKLSKLALAIQVELELPEIIVVQEVENTAILQVLGDRVNAAAGTDYVATSFETSDARGIEVGFLWDDDRVDLLDAYQMSGTEVEDAFGPSSPSPGREPLVGVFDIEGQEITIVGNHFKSKGDDDPLFGVNWPPIRVTEVQRKAQAQVVRDFVNTILDADANALVMVTGDLNDFQFGEPGEGPDHPIAILEGGAGEVPLTNLVNLEKEAEAYTYVYDGNTEVLDHMLVSPALYDLFVAVDCLHFNAGFPVNLEGDASTPLRASDHDALEGRFRFR
jgi:predicted extracellular nuclease